MTEESLLEKVLRERPPQILYLEDDAADVELCVGECKSGVHRDPASTLQEFAEKLSAQVSDAVRLTINSRDAQERMV